jgi:tetratricopeptide (TPR) repeat protein
MTAPAIGEICRRLNGLPLAIELAAVRCKLFTPPALLTQLVATGDGATLRTLSGGTRDSPLRLRTLRDSIEWSYNLLSVDEKRLFAELAVFRGGRSLEAIQSVCSGDLSINPLDGLASLVDKNLVQQKEDASGNPRFIMLETIHEYARERLRAGGQEQVLRRRHAEYFVDLAEGAEPEFRQAGYEQWSSRFELDLDNLREVLAWALADGDVALGARLAGALCLFWYGNGYHVEGQRWTQRLLERLDEVSVIYLPKLLISAGHMAFLTDLDAAKPLFTRALALAREVGDRTQVAWALMFLGYTMVAKPEEAMPLVEESRKEFQALSHLPGVAQAWNIVGEIARFNGDDRGAERAYEECLAVCRKTGEKRRIVFMFANLAYLAVHVGDFERVRALGYQALRLARETNNRLDMAKTLMTVAAAAGLLSSSQHAVRWLGAAEGALESMGAFHQRNDQPEMDALVAAVRARLDETTFQRLIAEGRLLALDGAVRQALDEPENVTR